MLERLGPVTAERAVHDDVDPAELVDHGLGDPGAVLGAGHAAGDRRAPCRRSAAISSATSSSRLSVRATRATAAPSRASASAAAWPSPAPTPVTTATFSASSMGSPSPGTIPGSGRVSGAPSSRQPDEEQHDQAHRLRVPATRASRSTSSTPAGAARTPSSFAKNPAVQDHVLRYEQNHRKPRDYDRTDTPYDGAVIQWFDSLDAVRDDADRLPLGRGPRPTSATLLDVDRRSRSSPRTRRS